MGRRSSPVDSSTLSADRIAIKALTQMPDYQPINAAYSIENLLLLEQTLTQAEIAEARLLEALDQAHAAYSEGREVRINTSLNLHSAVLGAKAQALAQYGDDSYVIKAIGLTRRSDRKHVGRRKTVAQ